MEETTFISVDIEADGGLLGTNSMVSLGMAAFDSAGNLISTFYRNLEKIPEGEVEERCMQDFWEQHPERWVEANENPEPIVKVLHDFLEWKNTLPSGPQLFIAKPTVYDGGWISWYLTKFTSFNSFKLRWLDLGTIRFVLNSIGGTTNGLRTREGQIVKSNPKPHHALEDALEQGRVFLLYWNALKKISNTTLKEILRFD